MEDISQFIATFDALRETGNEALKALNQQIERFTKVRDGLAYALAVNAALLEEISKKTVQLYSAETAARVPSPAEFHERFVSEALDKARIPPASVSDSQRVLEAVIPNPSKTEAMWEIIARTMNGRVNFNMTEAGEALDRELGRRIGKNRPQLVRNNLRRHPERFRRNTDGTWTVINITADGSNDDEVLED